MIQSFRRSNVASELICIIDYMTRKKVTTPRTNRKIRSKRTKRPKRAKARRKSRTHKHKHTKHAKCCPGKPRRSPRRRRTSKKESSLKDRWSLSLSDSEEEPTKAPTRSVKVSEALGPLRKGIQKMKQQEAERHAPDKRQTRKKNIQRKKPRPKTHMQGVLELPRDPKTGLLLVDEPEILIPRKKKTKTNSPKK
jgi:hypothetical protein